MNSVHSVSILFFTSVFLFFFSVSSLASTDETQIYIIHVIPPNHDNHEDYHKSFLPTSTSPASLESENPKLIYSYSEVFSGFAARLTKKELDAMKKKYGYINAYPNRYIPLATTHSPDFLGLQTGLPSWTKSKLGQGIVIGMIDSGILPSHPSFNDQGLPPPPKGWNGTCEFKKGTCNNKIIGARAFGGAIVNTSAPPLDDAGHGTHTASTAAGNFVVNASFKGMANGTASGIAPHAHLAIYKVCYKDQCMSMDVLAGLEAATKDKVDIISFSLGLSSGPYQYDPIAIATFKAMEKGILVSCSAGNGGPATSTVSNDFPWVLTVGAGTMDRSIRSTVKLGNGLEFEGETLFQPLNHSSALLPLVYPSKNLSSDPDCQSLSGFDIRGKIVVCMSSGISEASRVDLGSIVLGSGGAGLILMNPQPEGYTTFADPHVLPASHVSYHAGDAIRSYVKSTPNPTATIVFKGTVIGSSPSKTVTFFSSRGPGNVAPHILKPDITGPGMNILAAWTPTLMNPVAEKFQVMLGTSMSTPHVSGAVALIKSVHPDWSPAMIKSAIMTTSDNTDPTGTPIYDEQYQNASFFAMGAGYVNPSRAFNPGLVYDIGVEDYISYFCGLRIGDAEISSMVQRNITCSSIRSIKEEELNYPAIVVDPRSGPVTVNRTVTNVGKVNKIYNVVIDMPNEVQVVVTPQTLQFLKPGEKKTFTVSISWKKKIGNIGGAQGNLKWVSGKQVVRSPIILSPRN